MVKRALQRLHRHRGFNELLSFLLLENARTVRHKDGALSRHFVYQAPDTRTAETTQLDFVSQTWAQALQLLGDGWMVETNILSAPLPVPACSVVYPDPVSQKLAEERRAQWQNQPPLISTFYLSLTYKPPEVLGLRCRRFALEGETGNALSQQLDAFEHTVHEFIGFLSRALIQIEVLAGEALLLFLSQCISGSSQRVRLPPESFCLDALLSSDDFMAGTVPKLGEQWIAVLSLDGLPSHSVPNVLDTLTRLPLAYRWSSRFIAMSPSTSKALLKRKERDWSSMAMGIMGVVRESLGLPATLNRDAEQMAEHCRQTQAQLSSGQIGLGLYNSQLILRDRDEATLQHWRDKVATHLAQLEFKVRVESVNASEAFLGSIPAQGEYNVRQLPVDTAYISHVLPTSQAYLGEARAPCPLPGYSGQGPLLVARTFGHRPFYVNLHVGDVGHTAILGPTGKGKSTLVACLMAAHRQYPGSRLVVLDKDQSHRSILTALDGAYFDLAEPQTQLGVLARVAPDNAAANEQALGWLEDVCRVQGVAVSPSQRDCLREAVERLSHESPVYKNLNHLIVQEAECRLAIAAFNQGQRQQLLNGTTPLGTHADVLGFELGEIAKASSTNAALHLPVIKALFQELAVLFADKRPTLLVLEEAWLYLKHPLFLAQLTDWFKTLRKANVAVVFISQDLEDIVSSSACSVIQNSCMTRIYLPNAAAGESVVRGHYEAFGLNAVQIEWLKHATPKQDYLYHSELGSQVFQLALGEQAQRYLCGRETLVLAGDSE